MKLFDRAKLVAGCFKLFCLCEKCKKLAVDVCADDMNKTFDFFGQSVASIFIKNELKSKMKRAVSSIQCLQWTKLVVQCQY